MTDAHSPTSLPNELPEARIVEVIEAVGQALKGEDGLALQSIALDEATLHETIDGAVREALDISPIKALIKAWKDTAEVSKLIGPQGPVDDKTRRVALVSHTLKANHTPEIHVELGKLATLKKIPVPVTFSLAISGLVLAIKNRHITEIASGHAQPEVTIKVETATLFKEKLRKINLPVDVKLYEAPATETETT